MDVVVNSNVQSPLVRTLARTKGKSESFTNHLKDNVPPVSFSKIALNPEGGSFGTYNRNYKFKIPQYGYLRNFVLKFSSNDMPLTSKLLDDLYADASSNFTYSKANLTQPRAVPSGETVNPNAQENMLHAYVPAEEGFSVSDHSKDPWAQMYLRVVGGQPLQNAAGTTATYVSSLGGARMCPFRYDVRDNTTDTSVYTNATDTDFNLSREGPSYTSVGATAGGTMVRPVKYALTGSVPVQYSNRLGLSRLSKGFRSHNTWDWCTQSNLSKFLGAIIPQVVTLSTHNRPIQTIYPLETLARINRMPNDLKNKYLGMIRPHLTASPEQGSSTYSDATQNTLTKHTGSYSTDRKWSCYFPCFFSFFEDTSMNLDTRFVENLEVDVFVNNDTNIFWSADLGDLSSTLGSSVASYNSSNTNVASTAAGGRIEYSTYNPYLVGTLGPGVRGAGLSGSLQGPYDTLRHRRLLRVVSPNITVEALAYYYNFHDTTSQAIRDANYKPNVPANLLTYNTYAENAVPLSAANLMNGDTITVNLSCNNLAFGLTFMIRRKAMLNTAFPELYAFQDFSQTLPIKNVTLSGSGQRLYDATGAECLMIDQWDNALSDNKRGSFLTNTSGIYADNMASSHIQNKPASDHFFGYYIPMGFSQDMTYNSGSIALQTINNPTLTVVLHPLDGWVVQDNSLAVKNASFFNRNSTFGDVQGLAPNTSTANPFIQDGEFELVVFENYWQMVRIDSNTGAITKSLDL